MTTILNGLPLDPATGRAAVADYAAILRAGALATLRAELGAAYREHDARRCRQTVGDALGADTVARDLARLLGCDPRELRPYIGDDRRSVALTVLRDLAARCRRQPSGGRCA